MLFLVFFISSCNGMYEDVFYVGVCALVNGSAVQGHTHHSYYGGKN